MYLQGFTSSRSRRELKPHVLKLFGDESLVTRQLVEDLLKYKRLDGVQECLEALAGRLTDAGDHAEDARRIIDAVPTLVIWGAGRPHHPGRPRPRSPEPRTGCTSSTTPVTWCRWNAPPRSTA